MKRTKTNKLLLWIALVVIVSFGVYRFIPISNTPTHNSTSPTPTTLSNYSPTPTTTPPPAPPPPPTPTTLSNYSPPPTTTSRGTSVYTVVDSKNKVHTAFKESEDIRVVGFVGRDKAIVEVSERGKAELEANPRITFDGMPGKTFNDVKLRAGELTVVPLRTEDLELIERVVKANGGEVKGRCGVMENPDLRIVATDETIAALMALPEARWIENYEMPVFFNYNSARTMKVNECWPSEAGNDCGTTGLGLTGAGQLITTCDSGIDTGNMETMHPDIKPNLVGFDFTYDERYVSRKDISGHGTHTAGSIVGTGAKSGGQFKGMAYGAKLWAWMAGAVDGNGSYIPSMVDNMFRPDKESYKNCGLVSHIYSASYGSTYKDNVNIYSLYTTASQYIDEYCWKNPDFLPVWAAGNYEADGLVTQGASKNALVVGALNGSDIAYFSSLGPTKDRRDKPDICAPGWDIISVRSSQATGTGWGVYDEYYEYMGGTSQATPLTAGTCALVREWLIKDRGYDDKETNKKPSSALIKAILMGGATDLGLNKNAQGAGRVNLRSSIAPDDGRAVYLKDRIPFAEGQQTVFTFTTTNSAPLDAQLVWVDYPGTPVSDTTASMLVNDLDLSLIKWNSQANAQDQSFDMQYGNGGGEPDRLNNAEAIHETNLASGTYKLVVNSTNILYNSTKGGAAALYLKGAFDERTVRVRDKLEDTHPLKIIVY